MLAMSFDWKDVSRGVQEADNRGMYNILGATADAGIMSRMYN